MRKPDQNTALWQEETRLRRAAKRYSRLALQCWRRAEALRWQRWRLRDTKARK